MNIYLLRHGEVENPKNVLYGRLPDFHLSEQGRVHIKRTAEEFIGKNIKKIYSSPLERAVETSKIVLEVLGLKETDLIIDERLIESQADKWQGTDLEVYKKTVVYSMSPKTQTEVELISHAGDRVLSVINGPIKDRGEDVVVVSHGDPLVGALINLTDDWSYVEHSPNERTRKYIPKGEFVELKNKNDSWEIVKSSY